MIPKSVKRFSDKIMLNQRAPNSIRRSCHGFVPFIVNERPFAHPEMPAASCGWRGNRGCVASATNARVLPRGTMQDHDAEKCEAAFGLHHDPAQLTADAELLDQRLITLLVGPLDVIEQLTTMR